MRLDEPLGSIYLLGYTIEIWLKAAYYRLKGVPPNADLARPIPPNTDSPRKLAEQRIKALLGPSAPKAIGHFLIGWAELVIDARSTSPHGPYATIFRDDRRDYVKDAALCWTESLRYHANKPHNQEMHAVADAARWLKSQYRQLWSKS
ncbi:MAG: hypothetical protein ABSH20_05945 [Tepidisphaeraceae bacterium]